MTIAAIFSDDVPPSIDNSSWAGLVVSDVASGDGIETDGGGSANISSMTFSGVIYEAILFTARSIKVSHAASYRGIVKYGRGTWRKLRPSEQDRVPPSVSTGTPGTLHLRGYALCRPGLVRSLVVRVA